MSDSRTLAIGRTAVLLALGLGLACPGAASAQATAAAPSIASREADARQIANLMGRRAALQARGDNDGWIDLYATKQPDVSFMLMGTTIKGLDALKKMFNYGSPPRAAAPGTGSITIHGLLSPIIEIAEDGRTAKGFWQSAGPLLFARGGPPAGTLSWENYGVDFIKEDGKWKLWHVAVFPDVNLPMNADMLAKFAMSTPTSEQPRRGGPPASGGARPPSPYPEWTPGRASPSYPLPEPYRTFSETFSYGDLPAKN